jgi:large subunit ribosomal protein L14
MIKKNTILKVIDNSGAKTAMCIYLGKGFKKNSANLGDTIVVTVKTLRKKRRLLSKVKKGDVCKALIVRVKKKNFQNKFGDFCFFYENCIVLLNKQNKYIFTRIFGGILAIFRYSRFSKIISLSSGIQN